LIESQEAERKRVAAELHNSLGRNLLIIKNRAALGLMTSKDLDSAKQQLDAISASATQAIDETRQSRAACALRFGLQTREELVQQCDELVKNCRERS
jgi:signal transduction histidine kinase